MFCPRYTIGCGVFCQPSKKRGGFCPRITKWTWGVMSVGCFVRIPEKNVVATLAPLLAHLRCLDHVLKMCM